MHPLARIQEMRMVPINQQTRSILSKGKKRKIGGKATAKTLEPCVLCPVCAVSIRPCNMKRHLRKVHLMKKTEIAQTIAGKPC